ncbi:MAG: histidine kinase [Flavobacteriaceae bacterium]
MKKHLFITLIGATLGVLITYFIVIGGTEDSVSLNALEISSSIFAGISSAYLIYFIALRLDVLLPWNKYEGNRLLIGILIHFVSTFLWVFLLIYSYNSIFLEYSDFQQEENQYLVKLGIILFILIIIIEIIYFALYSYYSYTTFQIATVKQERKQIELQLKALKSQLSPHFLFNSLNTISSLVFKDENKAEGFIRCLADMYQYTLSSYQLKLTSLKEELAFVNSYQYLLETRFGGKLECSISIDEKLLATKIPPLTIQMLLENAVKHNVLDEKNPLLIHITADEKYIKVENNITSKPKQVTSFKIGLKNINARYLLLYKEGIMVTNGERFEVKIPIIS